MGIEVATTADLTRVIQEEGLKRLDEPITLASGDPSYYFVDVKRALSRGAVLRGAGRLLSHAARVELGVDYTVIAGPAMGGICVANAIQWEEEGRDRDPPPRTVYDDPGFPEGATVVGAVSVVVRGPDPAAMFAEMGIPFAGLVSYHDLGIPAVGTEVIQSN